MKIFLLGKNGQVGSQLMRTLLPLGNVVAFGRSELNLEDTPALINKLQTHKPDIIINAAAYTSVDQAETDIELAYMINTYMVKTLADYCKKNNSMLVHYSTDYVFDGKKQTPYLEGDSTNPLNVYGSSKRAAEEQILQSNCSNLIFRTSWVFSAEGRNFIKTILKLAEERSTIKVISDQVGAPTSAELIADVTAIAISAYLKGSMNDGIYHLTASGSTSWHNLAKYVVGKAMEKGKKLKLELNQIEPISTENYPLPAARPRNSRLDTSLLSTALGLCISDWQAYVDRTCDQLIQV